MIAVGTDKQFRALTEILGCAELADERDFATNSERVANRERLRELLEARLRAKPAADWVPSSRARGCPPGRSTTSPAPSPSRLTSVSTRSLRCREPMAVSRG